MSEILIQLEGEQTAYRPGEKLRGAVTWSAEAAPKSVEVRLFWFTTGAGPRQIGIAAKNVISHPAPRDTRRFEFLLPAKPWSFAGRLAGLRWAVEAVALPSRAWARSFIDLSRDSEVVLLHERDKEEDA